MSQYTPNPIYLRVEKREDGHWVSDQFGPLDGPYETSRDAWSIVSDMERDYYGNQSH